MTLQPWGFQKSRNLTTAEDINGAMLYRAQASYGSLLNSYTTQTLSSLLPLCQTAKLIAVIGTTFKYPIVSPT